MKKEIEFKEQELKVTQSEDYIRLNELKQELQELTKEDNNLREEGKEILINAGLKKFEALDGTVIQLNKTPGKLVIDEEASIDEYKKEKVTITIDKKAIKEDLKQGLIIDGVRIEENYKLVIKQK